MVNIDNTIILTKNFNIKDSDWDPSFWHHSSHTEDLITIADNLGLELSFPSNPGPTKFADNPCDTNSIIDLIFLSPDNTGFGQYTFHPEIYKPSDHIPLIIEIGIREINTDINIWSIKKDSEKEKNFIISLVQGIQNLNTSAIRSKENLESLVQQLANILENVWSLHSKLKHITKHFKEWWNQDCTDCLNRYYYEAWNIFRPKINQILWIHTPRNRTKIESPARKQRRHRGLHH